MTKSNSHNKPASTKSLEKKIEELTNDLQRIQADFVNFRNRSEENEQRLMQLAKAQVLSRILPLIDNIDRAMAVVPKDLKEHLWAQGVVKTAEQLKTELSQIGLERIITTNKPFDPELMEAIEVNGEGQNEVVAEEVQTGWKLDNQVLRHAIVKVKRR